MSDSEMVTRHSFIIEHRLSIPRCVSRRQGSLKTSTERARIAFCFDPQKTRLIGIITIYISVPIYQTEILFNHASGQSEIEFVWIDQESIDMLRQLKSLLRPRWHQIYASRLILAFWGKHRRRKKTIVNSQFRKIRQVLVKPIFPTQE